MKYNVVHLTSVHNRSDVRIFYKMCKSLASSGYNVTLVVADGLGDTFYDGVSILDVGINSGRFLRFFAGSYKILFSALKLNADIYHLHDPELMFIGLILKFMGKRVVFDSHEDTAKQILIKNYIPYRLRRLISFLYAIIESGICRWFDGVVAATPHIRLKFEKINDCVVDIKNFPILSTEMLSNIQSQSKYICYIGDVSVQRGVVEVVKSLAHLDSDIRLVICGRFSDTNTEVYLRSLPEWHRVDYMGFLDRHSVFNVMSHASAGLVTLHPTITYIDSLPVKMFEYMAAELPVIASDFPLWREIIQRADCGLLVDPLSSLSIAKAVNYLLIHTEKAKVMGRNGRFAVINFYNWDVEALSLLEFYREIID